MMPPRVLAFWSKPCGSNKRVSVSPKPGMVYLAFLLSCFLAFLLSCFLAFLLSCFLAFLLSCILDKLLVVNSYNRLNYFHV